MIQKRRQTAGFTLIELVIFIVIVAVGIAGLLTVFSVTVKASSNPLLQKQAQALAEGLLEEIQTGYFAYCDGADAQVEYAKTAGVGASTGTCTGALDSYGPKTGETRPYYSVIHYASAANSATTLSSVWPSESSVAAPTGYSAAVTIGPAKLGNGTTDISLASGDALLISVKVTGPGTTTATAEGFKTRQVPQ